MYISEISCDIFTIFVILVSMVRILIGQLIKRVDPIGGLYIHVPTYLGR